MEILLHFITFSYKRIQDFQIPRTFASKKEWPRRLEQIQDLIIEQIQDLIANAVKAQLGGGSRQDQALY
mgnify:CR=1 FL=1